MALLHETLVARDNIWLSASAGAMVISMEAEPKARAKVCTRRMSPFSTYQHSLITSSHDSHMYQEKAVLMSSSKLSMNGGRN